MPDSCTLAAVRFDAYTNHTLKEAGLWRLKGSPQGKVSGRQTDKAELGRTTLHDKEKSNAIRTPYSR